MLHTKNIIIVLLTIPLFTIFIILFNTHNKLFLKIITLISCCLNFLLSILLWVWFDKSLGYFQYVNKVFWLPYLNINFTLGIDGISLFFVILSTLLVLICILTSWNSIIDNLKEYLISFLILEFFLIGAFCVLDLLLFYVFFESVLIPMFLIIGIWGSRERKIKAAYYFFFSLF